MFDLTEVDNLPDNAILIHLLLGQPGSGKDSRLALVAEEIGADTFRFGTIFERYAATLPIPHDLKERAKFFAEFETANTLVDDRELLRRIASAGYLSEFTDEPQLWAFKIAYYGGYKTGMIPDNVVSSIFDAELAVYLRLNQPSSIILNSYPKTMNQYGHLQRQLSGHDVPFVQGIAFLMEHTDWDVLEKRLADRLVCTGCSNVYAASEMKVTSEGDSICACGSVLKRRLDTHIFEKRKKGYLNHTAPMIDKIRQEWRLCAELKNQTYFDSVLVRREIRATLTTLFNNFS